VRFLFSSGYGGDTATVAFFELLGWGLEPHFAIDLGLCRLAWRWIAKPPVWQELLPITARPQQWLVCLPQLQAFLDRTGWWLNDQADAFFRIFTVTNTFGDVNGNKLLFTAAVRPSCPEAPLGSSTRQLPLLVFTTAPDASVEHPDRAELISCGPVLLQPTLGETLSPLPTVAKKGYSQNTCGNSLFRLRLWMREAALKARFNCPSMPLFGVRLRSLNDAADRTAKACVDRRLRGIGKSMLFALLHGQPNALVTTLKLVPLQAVLPL
ncbi:unnamed protein product, partial [Symbiodinium necroappetens]